MYRPILFAGIAVFALARGHGCGVEENAKGVNSPCTRDRDCARDLRCARGVCGDPDAAVSQDGGGGAADSGGDADDDG